MKDYLQAVCESREKWMELAKKHNETLAKISSIIDMNTMRIEKSEETIEAIRQLLTPYAGNR